jgi:hypothetical protein
MAAFSGPNVTGGDNDIYYGVFLIGNQAVVGLDVMLPYMLNDTNEDTNPMIITDNRGYWLLAWTSDYKTGGPDTNIIFSYLQNNLSGNWPDPQTLYGDADSNPAFMSSGAANSRGPSQFLYFSAFVLQPD